MPLIACVGTTETRFVNVERATIAANECKTALSPNPLAIVVADDPRENGSADDAMNREA